MADIILYFGSFNPIHRGHTSVAGYVLDRGLCDELWFVVSPRNPLKDDAGLAPDVDRLRMAEIAVAEELAGRNVLVSDAEFRMPKPSYTIDTLRALGREYPRHRFSLLVGADIMEEIERWKDHGELLRGHRFFVYPREGHGLGGHAADVTFLDGAPEWDCSSTEVREALSSGGDAGGMVSPGVEAYIREKGLYAPDGEQSELVRLTAAIERSPAADLYVERGKLYNHYGERGRALNDFRMALVLDPDNTEAENYMKMINEILDFRYLDYYNP